MAKKRKPHKAAKASVAKHQSDSKGPNPFEQFHAKRRFDILGATPKASKKKTGAVQLTKARAAAVNKRKATLLVEYKALGKANAFIDRRFGEYDESLSAEDKALLRYQKQRTRELTRAGRFNLTEEDDNDNDNGGVQETLTHLGQSLAAGDDDLFIKSAPRDDDDDLDDDLADQLVRDFHFGGGHVPEGPSSGQGQGSTLQGQHDTHTHAHGEMMHGEGIASTRPRTKKEVMQELMAKSKAHKAARQLQHEQDDRVVEELNETLQQLIEDRKLAALFRPAGQKMSQKADNSQDAAFDAAARELGFEGKAAAGERALTEEERALEQQQLAERLERERRRRMLMPADAIEGDDAAADDAHVGGYAGRRKRRAAEMASEGESDSDDDTQGRKDRGRRGAPGGDDEEDDFDMDSEQHDSSDDDDHHDNASDNDDGDGGSPVDALTQRRRARAAGDHPLQSSFRAASAALLIKHGVAPTKQAARDLARVARAQHSTHGVRDGAGMSEEEEEGSGDEEEEEEGSGDSGSDDGEEGVQVEEEDAQVTSSQEEGDEDEEGDTEEEETEEEEEQGREEKQQPTRHQNTKQPARPQPTIELTGPLELPYTLQLPEDFEGYMKLVHARTGDDVYHIIQRLRTSNAALLMQDNRRGMQELYGMLMQHFALAAGTTPLDPPVLHALTRHLADLTPQVPGYAAKTAQARLGAMLDRLQRCLKDPALLPTAWPHPRALLLFQLWQRLFPVSDRRHPVVTPMQTLQGGYLQLLPVVDHKHVAMGLFAAQLLMQSVMPAQRVVPEPLCFAVEILHKLSPTASTPASPDTPHLPTLDLEHTMTAPIHDPHFSSPAFRAAALGAAMHVVKQCADCYGDVAAAPEMFAGAVEVLRGLCTAEHCHTELQRLASSTLQHLTHTCMHKTRTPLVRAVSIRTADIKQYNPRFEEGYVAARDYDPDRERAEQRRLQRQVRKEARGAMRELRKDSAFMFQERQREKAAESAERTAAYKRAVSFLLEQQQDLKSGGQKGMHKGRKT